MYPLMFLLHLVIRPLFLSILRQHRRCPHHLECPIALTVLRRLLTLSMPLDGLLFYRKLRP